MAGTKKNQTTEETEEERTEKLKNLRESYFHNFWPPICIKGTVGIILTKPPVV